MNHPAVRLTQDGYQARIAYATVCCCDTRECPILRQGSIMLELVYTQWFGGPRPTHCLTRFAATPGESNAGINAAL